jgi:hypothetical protein
MSKRHLSDTELADAIKKAEKAVSVAHDLKILAEENLNRLWFARIKGWPKKVLTITVPHRGDRATYSLAKVSKKGQERAVSLPSPYRGRDPFGIEGYEFHDGSSSDDEDELESIFYFAKDCRVTHVRVVRGVDENELGLPEPGEYGLKEFLGDLAELRFA